MNGCETLGNLWDHWNECGKNVPETHGVYKIILPAEMELRFVEGIEGHPVADTYDVETLTDKYKQSGYSKLLYVGKAGGRRGLRQRIRHIAMYARGMSTRDIEAFVQNLYGVSISPDYVSAVTDRVLEDVKEWQNRPLDSVYPVAFFDALRVKIRSGASVKNMAVHLGIGVRTDGTREVLGMWIAENEGASFWASVFNGLKTRGVEDILIAVTDGLKGMTEAIETVYPQTLHQTCIVHLIRASTAFVSHKDRPAVCKELKPIYQAVDAEAAESALDRFESTEMGKRYPAIGQIWRRAWAQVIPFFQFPPEIRTLIYTTNSIEGLNRAIRKVIKTRTLFPSEDAARKLIYLAIRNYTETWTRASNRWSSAMPQFALLFGERFTNAME